MKARCALLIVCGVVMVMACGAASAQSTMQNVVTGDVSGDGVVNVADAVLVLRLAVGLGSPTPAQDAALPWRVDDTGRYRQVSVADALLVLRVALDMDRFPPVDKPVLVGEASFEWEVLRSGLPVLVEFYATWCPACQKLEPVIYEIAHGYAGRLRVAKVNVDVSNALTSQYGVRSIPTMLLVEDGEVLDRSVGYAEQEELSDWLDRRL
ncbi:MAG: thioredoxin domain-containing protein [Armatimonadota bacterium]